MRNASVRYLAAQMLLLAIGCGESPQGQSGGFEVYAPQDPTPLGQRYFGINISESVEGFDASFAVAQQAEVGVVEVVLTWEAIETAPGEYQDPEGVLSAIAFYGYNDIEVLLTLAVVNTVKRTTPQWLDSLDYDDPELVSAFCEMSDWVLGQVPANVTLAGISVGNEIDLVLTGSEWEDYTAFYGQAADHIRQSSPGIVVGAKCTVMEGVLGGALTQVQQLNQDADVVMLNYYPQDGAFGVMAPSSVHGHFDAVTAAFPGREVWFTELGYQSGSEHCGSSEEKQAEFYHEMFAAWDDHADAMGMVLVNWLHDQSPEQIAEWQEYYGSSDPGFVEFLSTLGLRNHDATDKYAWLQVLAEVDAR